MPPHTVKRVLTLELSYRENGLFMAQLKSGFTLYSPFNTSFIWPTGLCVP